MTITMVVLSGDNKWVTIAGMHTLDSMRVAPMVEEVSSCLVIMMLMVHTQGLVPLVIVVSITTHCLSSTVDSYVNPQRLLRVTQD